MQKCLGIYIEENLIKYAKVSKERDEMKVESFGIKFFQNLGTEIKKIIEETFSFNTPISINLANEKYLYFDVFALLNKKDIEQTVRTEFETFCDEKKYNKNAFETRFALMPNRDQKEKIRALNIYINKIELSRQTQPLEKYKLSKVMPISIAIGNIARLNKKENQLIVNMEENTTITTIYDKQIYDVETLDAGSKEVLDSINKVENSYSKAYEICKNTTIYTADVDGIGEEQPYLQYIIPTVYKIAQRVQEIVEKQPTKFQTIYLTGTLASVNNIDLYFQEFLPKVECVILKPNIIDEATTKLNIKEYIEVNSALALATAGLGEGIQELNFKKVKIGEKISHMLNITTSSNGKIQGDDVGKTKFALDFKTKLGTDEVWMVRTIAGLLLLLIIYISFSKVLSNQMIAKEQEINDLITQQETEIATINTDMSSLNTKNNKYETLISDLKKLNQKMSDIASSRNSIPNLLNQIMYAIPERVQLTSIENTTDKSITIKAQSPDYEQLGYFIATIKTKKILKNVVSSSGMKSGNTVTVTIEGELP